AAAVVEVERVYTVMQRQDKGGSVGAVENSCMTRCCCLESICPPSGTGGLCHAGPARCRPDFQGRPARPAQPSQRLLDAGHAAGDDRWPVISRNRKNRRVVLGVGPVELRIIIVPMPVE